MSSGSDFINIKYSFHTFIKMLEPGKNVNQNLKGIKKSKL